MKFNPFLFFYKKSAYLLLFYILLSLGLMNFNESSALWGIRSVLLNSVAFISHIKQSFWVLKSWSQENEALKREIFQVRLANQKLREALLENMRLKRFLQFKRESELRFVPAKVIGMGVERGVRSLILNVGKKDSVFKNSPVLHYDGLVGKIVFASAHQSIAQMLMDHNSLVSARLQKSREAGVISWSGDAWLNLLYIPKNIKVEAGEVVVTSGLSQIYPAGIKIGVVINIEENNYELFKKIQVKPAVEFNAIEEVFVVKRTHPQLLEAAASEE